MQKIPNRISADKLFGSIKKGERTMPLDTHHAEAQIKKAVTIQERKERKTKKKYNGI